MAIAAHHHRQTGLGGFQPEIFVGVHIALSVRVFLQPPTQTVGVVFQHHAGAGGGLQNAVGGGIAIAVPGQGGHGENVWVRHGVKEAGFQRLGNGIGVFQIFFRAGGTGSDVENLLVGIHKEMLPQKQVVHMVLALQVLVIAFILGQIFDFKTGVQGNLSRVVLLQLGHLGDVVFQLGKGHPIAIVKVRKGCMVGKAEDTEARIQCGTQIIFGAALRVPAALSMGMEVCFHRFPF